MDYACGGLTVPTKTTDKDEVQRLRARVRDLERAQRVLWALEQASVAMAKALSLPEVLESVGATLRDLGLQTTVLRLDEDRQHLHLHYLSANSHLLRLVEARVGQTRESFRVEVDRIEFYRKIVRERSVEFREDTRSVAAQVLPKAAASVVAFILKQLGMAQMIGGPLIKGDEVWGIMVISSRELTPEDRVATQVFLTQVSWTLHKASLHDELRTLMAQAQRNHEQLAHAQKMEAVGRFTAGIAHDLNNLLTAVVMAQESATYELSRGASADEDLAVIGTTADRAAALIRKLLAFSRAQILEREVVQLESVLQGVGPLLERLLDESIELEVVRAKGDSSWCVSVDVVQLEQVIVNLAVNARDAMVDGGRLRIETAHVPAGTGGNAARTVPHEAAGQRLVRLTVSDTGPGIPTELLSQIFDPFFTTKEQGRGTGLGLSVVHGIVTQHGGWLTVDSTTSGSQFHVWFPVARGPETRIEAAAKPPPKGLLADRCVLVVEDDSSIRELLARTLRPQVGALSTAAGVQDAELALAKEPHDVLVCDVVLPDGNGVQFCETAARRQPQIAVVLVSGYGDPRPDLEQVQTRGWVFLSKPFTVSQLSDAILRAVAPTNSR